MRPVLNRTRTANAAVRTALRAPAVRFVIARNAAKPFPIPL